MASKNTDLETEELSEIIGNKKKYQQYLPECFGNQAHLVRLRKNQDKIADLTRT